jgi:hypothetical protein
MGRAKFVKHRIAVVFALSFWPLPGVAQNSDALTICKVIQDHAIKLARAGESEKLKAMEWHIEECLKVAREEYVRATREFLERAAKIKAEQPK